MVSSILLVVLWFACTSRLQRSVTLSTSASEIVDASEEAKELVWLNRLSSDINGKHNIL